MREIFHFGLILPLDGATPPLPQAYITVERGIISDLGFVWSIDPTISESAHWHDFSSAIALPGFINSHVHLGYRRFSTIKAPKGSTSWLSELVRDSRQLDSAAKSKIAQSNIRAVLASGCTYVVENTPFEETIQALANSPLHAKVGWEVFGNDTASADSIFDRSLTKLKALQERFEGARDRLDFVFAPHSIYNVSAPLLKRLAAWSYERDLPLLLHLSEFEFEQMLTKTGSAPSELNLFHESLGVKSSSTGGLTGLTPTAYLERLGILDKNLFPTHLLRASDRDLELLAKSDITLCSCPRSGLWLNNGSLDWNQIERLDLKVSIGTDGLSSNFDLDLREELKAAWLIHRAKGQSLSAQKLLQAITSIPAQQLGIGHERGSLSKGKKADLLIFEPPDGFLQNQAFLKDPYEDILRHILNRLKSVWINGERVWTMEEIYHQENI
ncbi:MAG: amidohydrolase family protein [Candidatus Caenarcaniphilales bacterium]|nr:amidohydrolase family protein [Candidatus Caenarcaniphilales bacterium]